MSNSSNKQTTVDTSHPLGLRLKQAREKKGLSIEDVAKQTYILKRHLISLEENNFEALLQPTFARGFAISYGKFLGIDPQIIIQSFEAQYPSNLRQKYENFEKNAPLSPMGTLQRDSRNGIKINWIVIVIAIVALILAVFIFRTVTKAHSENQPAEQKQEVTIQEQTDGASLSNTGSTSNTQPNNMAIGSSTQNAVTNINNIDTTPQSTLDIWIKDTTNITITDATGNIMLQGEQPRGSHKLTGKAPFNVQIDKASNVSIDWNKQPIRISQYAQNNQANFTLN